MRIGRRSIAALSLCAVAAMALAPAFTCTAPEPARAVSRSMPCHTSDDMKGCCCAAPEGSPAPPSGGCNGWCDMPADSARGPSGQVAQTLLALDAPQVAQALPQSMASIPFDASPHQPHPPSLALTPLRI